MKQGYTAISVLVIVGVVLALGALFVVSESSNPTGYAGSPAGGVTAFVPSVEEYIPCNPENNNAECTPPETCQYYEGYSGYYCGNGDQCDSNADCDFLECDEGDLSLCEFPESSSSECECVDPCEEGDSCETDAESGDIQCGGVKGGVPAAEACLPTEPDGENGGCDCNDDGCTEGAFCSQFGVASHPFVNPCGPNGHCEITGSEGGTVFGQCACGDKPCELLDAEGFQGEPDQCEDTVQCDEDSVCDNHDDCGGLGLGRCSEGICDCECVSWAPCQNDLDCGNYGEGGNFGQCIVGSDGAAECMCTDNLGCSPQDCIPGETPCSGGQQNCGGDGEDNCIDGICDACGTSCELPCVSQGCADGLTQEECDIVAQELGSTAGCTMQGGDKCVCPDIPEEMCDACYSLDPEEGLVGSCG